MHTHAHTHTQDVPRELGCLTGLQSLDLRGNPLRQPFARIAEARGDLALVAYMQVGGGGGGGCVHTA